MPGSRGDKVLAYWDRAASSFDAIYTGEKSWGARLLDRLLRRDMYQRFDWVLRNSGDLKGKSICDLGCGTGRYVIAYARSGARRVLGIDGAPNMVREASLLIEQALLRDRAELREANILDCTEEEVFDITIAVGVFDYTRSPSLFLKKIRKITGSRFLVTFPRFWTYRMPIRRIRLGFLGCPVYFYTAQEIKTLLAEAGFCCQRIEAVGAIYCVLGIPSSRDKDQLINCGRP
jgi:SAM-dependent methyltransferase